MQEMSLEAGDSCLVLGFYAMPPYSRGCRVERNSSHRLVTIAHGSALVAEQSLLFTGFP